MICRSEDKDALRVQEEGEAAGYVPDLSRILSSPPNGGEDFLMEGSSWKHVLP